MRLETKKYLLDVQQAAALASEFVVGRTFDDYQQNAMPRAAVERQCEIIGEALTKLAKADEPVAARIHDSAFVLDAGTAVYLLSDQETAGRLAARKVIVVGTVDPKTRTIQVESMATAK